MINNEFYQRLIKPIRDDHIVNIIKQAPVEVFSPWDKDLTWDERIRPIMELRKKFTLWSKELVSGLESFQYMYVMNGNTDSLNTLFAGAKHGTAWKYGDYSYYKHWHSIRNKDHKELIKPTKVPTVVASWPGYTWGNREQLDFANECETVHKHLDCAYLALTNPDLVDISNFQTASFSFSKTLAIPYNRISILFSKDEIESLSIMNKLGYVNLSGVKLVNHILDQLSADYWWSKYGPMLDDLCQKNDLRKTDCILFAYKDSNRVSLAEYWKDYLK